MTYAATNSPKSIASYIKYRIPILLYHCVYSTQGLSVTSRRQFRRHLEWLNRHGWRTLTLAEFEDAVENGVEIGPRRFLMTFDDGLADLRICADLMMSFGYSGVSFVITSKLDGADPKYITSDELICMTKANIIEVQSHTHRHALMRDNQSCLDGIADDLMSSRRYLCERLGVAEERICHLAWPWGICFPRFEAVARDLGFKWQYLVQRGAVNRIGFNVRLPRFCADGASTSQLARWLTVCRSRTAVCAGNRIIGMVRTIRGRPSY